MGVCALVSEPFQTRMLVLTHYATAGNQVTPFKLSTPDGETIYAWHVLPLRLYARHEESISSSREPGLCEDVKTTESFRLLKEDPDAKVIVCRKKCPIPARRCAYKLTPFSPWRKLSSSVLEPVRKNPSNLPRMLATSPKAGGQTRTTPSPTPPRTTSSLLTTGASGTPRAHPQRRASSSTL